MSAGDWIGLGAVIVFAIFVGIVAVPILKLGRLFDELRCSVKGLTGEVTPTLNELTQTVSQVNHQMGKADAITTHIADASANVSALTSLVGATLGKPLIKVSAFSFAVRKALRKRRQNFAESSPGPVLPEPHKGTSGSAYLLRDSDPGFFEASGENPAGADGKMKFNSNDSSNIDCSSADEAAPPEGSSLKDREPEDNE